MKTAQRKFEAERQELKALHDPKRSGQFNIFRTKARYARWGRRFALTVALVALITTGCANVDTGPNVPVEMKISAAPWADCDHLFGTFGNFMDADGCYRAIRGVCKIVVRSQPNNPQAQADTEAHERRHCAEGDFHHGQEPIGQ